MSAELVVFDATGTEVDWIDPYESHRENDDGTVTVQHTLYEYEVEIPAGGRYEIRPMEVSR